MCWIFFCGPAVFSDHFLVLGGGPLVSSGMALSLQDVLLIFNKSERQCRPWEAGRDHEVSSGCVASDLTSESPVCFSVKWG